MTPETFVSIINQSLPEPHASLLAGMIFGQKYSRMGAEFYQALVRTGTLHVVALSGTNITILIKLIEKLSFPLGGRRSGIIMLVAILGFVLFVGAEPPIVRAAIMGGIATLADFLGKRQYAFLSLLFASGVMFIVWPEWLYSLSFQLSFLATLGIIVFDSNKRTIQSRSVPFFEDVRDNRSTTLRDRGQYSLRENLGDSLSSFENKSPKFSIPLKKALSRLSSETRETTLELAEKARVTFVENLRTTLAAQVFITPLLVYNFGRLSLVAPLSNALAMWSVGPITWLGVFLAVGGVILWPMGRILAWVAWFFLEYFILVVEWTSRIPYSEVVF